MTDITPSPRLTVELPLHRAKRAAAAILPHISTEDDTPVLTAAQMIDGHLVATDRYSVGRIRLVDREVPPERQLASAASVGHGGRPEESEKHYAERLAKWERQHSIRYLDGGVLTDTPPEFLVPREALQRIATLGASYLLGGKTLEDEARVRIEAWSPRIRGDRVEHERVDIALMEGDSLVFRQTFLGVLGNFPPVHRLLDEWKPAEEPTVLNMTSWNLAKVTKFADRFDVINLTAGHQANAAKMAPVRLTVGDDFTGLLQPVLKV